MMLLLCIYFHEYLNLLKPISSAIPACRLAHSFHPATGGGVLCPPRTREGEGARYAGMDVDEVVDQLPRGEALA